MNFFWSFAKNLRFGLQKACVLLLFVAFLFQTDIFAGQITVTKNNVTFTANFGTSTDYPVDANGYLSDDSPGDFGYSFNISNPNGNLAYAYVLGQYNGAHCYWGGEGLFDSSWYMYKMYDTQGIIVAFLVADDYGELGASWVNGIPSTFWESGFPTYLGISADGGPSTTDVVYNTRISYDANFHFGGMEDSIVIKIPWSQVFGAANITYNIPSSPCRLTGTASANKFGKNPLQPGSLRAEPVDTATGAHLLNIPLLLVHGAQDLNFQIAYNSIARLPDILGNGWSHNFETSVQQLPNGNIQVSWNANNLNDFAPQVGNQSTYTCTDTPVCHDVLIQNADGSCVLTDPTQQKWEFDSFGRLSTFVNSHGQQITLSYQSTNQHPYQITETVSQNSLFFAYDQSNRLTQISNSIGTVVAFNCDTNNNLVQFQKYSAITTNLFTFAYDSSNRITSEVNPERYQVFSDTYDANDRVVQQEDAVGAVTSFIYDESQTNRVVTTVIDRMGATNIYTHDQNYMLLSEVDALGNTKSYGYDASGDLTAITNALGQVLTFTYDGSGNKTSETDALGNTTYYAYDDLNRLVATTNSMGNTATIAYDANNNVTTSVDFMTNIVTMLYDANAQLSQQTLPRGGVTHFVHAGGLMTSMTDAANNTTTIGYDAIGRVSSTTNADGYVSTSVYDLNGNLVAMCDGLGDTWQASYDSTGKPVTKTDPLGNTDTFIYNGNEDMIRHTDPLGNATLYAYDPEERLTTVTDANGNAKTMAYDAAGRLISIADALNHTNWIQYDAVGNVIATVDALGITNRFTAYDSRNQPILTQDAMGSQTRMSYDVLMRLAQSKDPLNRTNTFTYDSQSRLTASSDPLSLVRRQQFDSDGNRTGVINPKCGATILSFDLAERLTGTATPAGKHTSYVLNGRNLPTQITQPSGAQTMLTYDGAGRLTNSQDSAGTVVCIFDQAGHLMTSSESGQSIIRHYDAAGRLTNYVDAAGNVIGYAYDSVGNLTNLVYPHGKQVFYAYDAANRLTSVTDWLDNVTTFTWDADNRITGILHPNGTVTTYTYDLAGRLLMQQDLASSTNVICQAFYVYDAANQITSELRQPAATPYESATVSLGFDTDDALTNYAGSSITNDANGNMIWGPLTNGIGSFAYDVRNRLTSAGGTSYGYDPAGNRVAVTNGTTVTQFVINPNAVLPEALMRIQNGVTNYYVYGAGLLYQVTPTSGTNVVLNYHYDYRGSTVAITDQGANLVDHFSYSPYGSITFRSYTTDTPFLYNGRYGVTSDGNGLFCMRARFYNPQICRFVNPDPSGLSGGLNRYAYANGNPLNLTDPFGLCAIDWNQVYQHEAGSFILGGSIAVALTETGAAAALLSNPIGWAILIAGGVAAVEHAYEVAALGTQQQQANLVADIIGGGVGGGVASVGTTYLAESASSSVAAAPQSEVTAYVEADILGPEGPGQFVLRSGQGSQEIASIVRTGDEFNRVFDSRWQLGPPYSQPMGGSLSPGLTIPSSASQTIIRRGLNWPGVVNNAEMGVAYRAIQNMPATKRTALGGTDPEILIAPPYRNGLQQVGGFVPIAP